MGNENGGQGEVLGQRCEMSIKEVGQKGQQARMQKGQWPHAGMILKISEVVLVAEYRILGSMCSRDGMSIFMGKPGR